MFVILDLIIYFFDIDIDVSIFHNVPFRVPRVELGKATFLGKDGHLLSKRMHDEDGKYGLHLTNARGDQWTAYGDGMLLDEKSKDSLRLVTEAVRQSDNHVHEAYCHPTKPLDTAVVTDLIPFVDKEEENGYPLLQMKDGKLHRRKKVHDRYDCRTVTNWWGPTTVLESYVPETLSSDTNKHTNVKSV